MNLAYILKQILLEEKKKADRCKRIADRKYDKPSAYKSGAIVRCRQGNIWKDLKEEILNEYSTKIINQLIDRFKQEQPSLDTNIIQAYINRFTQIRNSPKISEKDITKYSWKELETAIDSNQPKRIKAGKINDGEPSKDANLVYNQNQLRIYVGKTKEACIKYGNGYSFCISARGDQSMYHTYRYGQGGTPYFIFDDTKSSEQDENGEFIDPEHLLVVFKYESPEEGSEYGDGYSITNANNPGEKEFDDFNEIEKYYPRLKGLKNIFQPAAADPKEKAEYKIKEKYNKELSFIEGKYREQDKEFLGKNWSQEDEDFLQNNYMFSSIVSANKNINDFLNGKIQIYKFTAKLKPTVNKDDYIAPGIQQYRFGDPEKSYKGFAEETLITAYDGLGDPKDSVKNWDITYKKQEIRNNTSYKSYLEEVKQLVDKYRNELTKLRILKETNDPQSGKAAPYGSGYSKLKEIIKKIIQEDESLHKWFKRQGTPGKEGGWVDCNTCRDGKCKACGRKKGEKRSKYPSCRPTPAQCKTKGKGKKWGKTK